MYVALKCEARESLVKGDNLALRELNCFSEAIYYNSILGPEADHLISLFLFPSWVPDFFLLFSFIYIPPPQT